MRRIAPCLLCVLVASGCGRLDAIGEAIGAQEADPGEPQPEPAVVETKVVAVPLPPAPALPEVEAPQVQTGPVTLSEMTPEKSSTDGVGQFRLTAKGTLARALPQGASLAMKVLCDERGEVFVDHSELHLKGHGFRAFDKVSVGESIELRSQQLSLGMQRDPTRCEITVQAAPAADGKFELVVTACLADERVELRRCDPEVIVPRLPEGAEPFGLQWSASVPARTHEFTRAAWDTRVAVRLQQSQAPTSSIALLASCKFGRRTFVDESHLQLGAWGGFEQQRGEASVHSATLFFGDHWKFDRHSECALRAVARVGGAEVTVREGCIRNGEITDDTCGLPASTQTPVSPSRGAFTLRSIELEPTKSGDEGVLEVTYDIELNRPVTSTGMLAEVECSADGRTAKGTTRAFGANFPRVRPGENVRLHSTALRKGGLKSAPTKCRVQLFGGPFAIKESNRFSMGTFCHEGGATKPCA